jgi:3-phytase
VATVVLVAAAALVACGSGGSDAARPAANAAESASSGITERVSATVQTEPVSHSGDAADDPAIWVNPNDPAQSTIIGTDKKGGLVVYDLTGQVIQEIPNGKMNNVDLRDGFTLAGAKVSLVAASVRAGDRIALYRVDPATRRLVDVAARPIELSIGAYGLCMYRSSKTGKTFVFVNSKKGEVEQWQLFTSPSKKGKVDARRVRAFDAGTQTEGCVTDDGLRRFYIGEEDEAIWRYGAEPAAGTARTKVDTTGGGGHLKADVEGLTIAYSANGTGYLIASSQGSDSYAVYRREGANAYVGSFEIVAGNGIGGAEDTDGIDVSTANLGPAFPQGVFVAQDGRNDGANQNFKLVPWEAVVAS